MANAVVKYYLGLAGAGSITCALRAKGAESGAAADTITLTEIGSTGCYSGTTAAALNGLYWTTLTGGMVDGGFVEMTDDTSDHVIQAGAFDWDTNNKASSLLTNVAEIEADIDASAGGGGATLGQIISGLTAAALPITLKPGYDPATGILTLVRGRDYKAAEGRAQGWSVPLSVADLSQNSPTVALLICKTGKATVSIAGTITNAGASNQAISFEIPAAKITIPAADITAPYRFEAVATFANSDVVPLVGPGPCVIVQNAAS